MSHLLRRLSIIAVSSLASVGLARVDPGHMSPQTFTRCAQGLEIGRFEDAADNVSLSDVAWATWIYETTNVIKSAELTQALARHPDLSLKTVINDPSAVLRILFYEHRDYVAVAFRGTENWRNVISDSQLVQLPSRYTGIPGRVHAGFWKLLARQWSPIEALIEHARDSGKPIWFSGHSMGGALATLAAARAILMGHNASRLVTLAAPRVGDDEFARIFEGRNPQPLRVVLGNDIVPRLMPSETVREDFIEFIHPMLRPLARLAQAGTSFVHVGRPGLLSATGAYVEDPDFVDDDDDAYWQTLRTRSQGRPVGERKAIAEEIWYQHWPENYSCALAMALKRNPVR